MTVKSRVGITSSPDNPLKCHCAPQETPAEAAGKVGAAIYVMNSYKAGNFLRLFSFAHSGERPPEDGLRNVGLGVMKAQLR